MIALITKRITISPKAKIKSPLSLSAVVIYAYYKYVIFVRFSDLFSHYLLIVSLSSVIEKEIDVYSKIIFSHRLKPAVWNKLT